MIDNYLTCTQLAKATNKARPTIVATAKNIPGGFQLENKMWLFPQSAIKHVLKRRPGAPKKNQNWRGEKA